ncbi:Crp/Fnr family transcriptional regulator [Anaerosinus massiliensis]|uniref:Crp/Fnr family transcriptional regulator n=1 Tax=Massilibacillus massiliensis TaxID=1806837 RepID=UPI000A8B6EAE|nr:Crp/Fnr family transcriptional regulator [Massilibacillus massiliensis]
MKKNVEFLRKVRLFRDMDNEKIEVMMNCLGAVERRYKKDTMIFMAGDPISEVGIILKGTVQVIKEDMLGNRSIVAHLTEGELFAETLACAGVLNSPVTTVAMTNCEILFIGFRRIITSCTSSCEFHSKLIENMLNIIAQKNIVLNYKLNLLSQRTIGEKLRTYFLSEMEKTGSDKFMIPFSRNELADFLCVDRSALSRELSKLRDQGKIKFNKNEFEIMKL